MLNSWQMGIDSFHPKFRIDKKTTYIANVFTTMDVRMRPLAQGLMKTQHLLSSAFSQFSVEFHRAVCPENTYGVMCSEKCACQNGGTCSSTDGSCSCSFGWKGKTCNECKYNPSLLVLLRNMLRSTDLCDHCR